jgi:hypothetical protein
MVAAPETLSLRAMIEAERLRDDLRALPLDARDVARLAVEPDDL